MGSGCWGLLGWHTDRRLLLCMIDTGLIFGGFQQAKHPLDVIDLDYVHHFCGLHMGGVEWLLARCARRGRRVAAVAVLAVTSFAYPIKPLVTSPRGWDDDAEFAGVRRRF